MYAAMKKLITRHFYKTKEEVVNRLDVYSMFGRITLDQYEELMNLTNEYYPDLVE